MSIVKKSCAGLAAVAAIATGIAVSESGAAGAVEPTCSFTSLTTSSWDNGSSRGFTESLQVKNLGSSSVSNWTIAWNVGNRRTVTKLWTANWSQAGRRVTATPTASNATIYAGKTVSFGYTALGRVHLARVVALNGMPCTRA